MKKLLPVVTMALAGLGMSISSMSHATVLSCDPRYEDNVQVSTSCELGTTNNDSEAQVNADLIFGYNDWTHAWTDDSGDALPSAVSNWVLDGDLFGGSFSVTWATPSSGQAIFVLKDGHDDPDTYVAYQLDPGTFGLQNYTFETPFLNTTSGSPKQISHAAFYYRAGGPETRCVDCTGTNDVPEPAPLFLMGLGLLALRSVVKRRKA